jgi:hypothetical protein
MNPTPTPDDRTESRDTELVEFSDNDHPWEPIPREEMEDILRRSPPRKPNGDPPASPDTPAT